MIIQLTPNQLHQLNAGHQLLVDGYYICERNTSYYNNIYCDVSLKRSEIEKLLQGYSVYRKTLNLTIENYEDNIETQWHEVLCVIEIENQYYKLSGLALENLPLDKISGKLYDFNKHNPYVGNYFLPLDIGKICGTMKISEFLNTLPLWEN